ncbi:MAG: hypothetical protein FJX77_17710 [Armatimonadetes bacterium]|nr:hypothetical protein [Armatimonadota bacterium]
MIITTATCAGSALDYANQVTDKSRYYVILLQDEDIQRIVADRASIVDILNVKARRVFARKELGVTEFGSEPPTTGGPSGAPGSGTAVEERLFTEAPAQA